MSVAKPIQFLGFLLDERHYGVRLSEALRVVRAVDYTPLRQAPHNILGIIDLHGEVVPLYNMRGKLGLIERDILADDQFIIALTAGRTVALAVDSVTGIIAR
jgi:purine-binding chemotaxis protein CheW